MARNSVNGDAVNTGDNLDNLLSEFRSRNEFRADPNYVLEPVDVDTPIPDRFIKILRDSSLSFPEHEETDATIKPESEPNSGLILLAENYDKKARTKFLRGRVFAVLSSVILFVAVIMFSAYAGYILSGITVAIVAAVFLVLSRTSRSQATEIKNIASALNQPEETS